MLSFAPGGAFPGQNAMERAGACEKPIHCEHSDRCGGCPLIDLDYSEQLEKKQSRVLQAAAQYPALELVRTRAIMPSPALVEYRTRAKLIVAPGGRIGLFAKGGEHEVIDIPGCRVLSPSLARVAARLRERLAAPPPGEALEPFQPAAGGCLRALDLREVLDGDVPRVLLTLVVERRRAPDVTALAAAAEDLLRATPELLGVAANFQEGAGPQILGSETVPLAGAASAPDRVGTSLQFATFGSFVQANRDQARRVHALVAQAIDVTSAATRKARVLDLYGGSGAIALALAASGASVQLVESFAPAVAQARAAAHAQGLDVDAHCADVTAALRAMSERRERFDAVVLNPPRRGTSASAREWLARLEAPVLAYVSCDPDTLARDLDHFVRLGYRATWLCPVDMLPQTDQVEVVAILHRSDAPPPRVAYEDGDVIVVDKGPHEPTVPQGEYATSLLARVRRIPGAEHAVPVHRLDVGTSGLVTFARLPRHVARWQGALSATTTRKVYVAAVRGVAPSKGVIARDLRDGGKLYAARTRYRRIGVAGRHSVLCVVPEQGRTHQIRRHLASIGHPVLGDERYGHAQTNRHFAEKRGLDRTFLHCLRLELVHPSTNVRVVIEAALPGDLRLTLERMEKLG
jgi:23S rRNA (uracil1939-C5)-methyltransferase